MQRIGYSDDKESAKPKREQRGNKRLAQEEITIPLPKGQRGRSSSNSRQELAFLQICSLKDTTHRGNRATAKSLPKAKRVT